MKSKLTLCSLLALSIAFTSCKNDEKTETEVTTNSNTPQQIVVPRVDPVPVQNQPNQQIAMPVQNVPQAAPQAQAPVITKAGMNPAHGQPGHRCDIPVGAPLNSVAAKSAATPGKATFTTATIPTPTATGDSGAPVILKSDTPVVTAPGMNPPHGQEGHRCDIAVGEPLNKPKTDD
ncbi:MAG: hypothetical protein QM710_04770 [Flavobacterium sp.]